LKTGFHAMRMPCDTLLAIEDCINVAALAWTLKAWVGLRGRTAPKANC
jgi:hypothetical protein